jgi:hypothetical protein
MTMLTNTNLVLAIALVMGAGSFASAAQTDGDNNRVPGAQTQVTGSLASAFASARVPATVRHSGTRSMVWTTQRDGDGNRVPGAY